MASKKIFRLNLANSLKTRLTWSMGVIMLSFFIFAGLSLKITFLGLDSEVTHLRAVQLVLIIIAAGISIRAALRVRAAASRIEEISAIAHRINEGDWSVAAPVSGGRELEMLGREFNQMTQKLHHERDFVDDIITSMAEVFLLISNTGRINRINNACIHFSGYEKHELIGLDIGSLLVEHDALLTMMSNITRIGYQEDLLISFKTKDGALKKTSVVGTAIFDDSAQVIGATLLVKDMTGYHRLLEESRRRAAAEAIASLEKERSEELRQMNEKLKETQAQIVEAGKFAALGEMAGGIAHEVNNPLAIIHGKASLLRDMVETGAELNPIKLLDIAEKIESTAMRVAQIVKGLRSFARDGTNEPMQQIEAAQIVWETLDLCREKFRILGVELRISAISTECALECRSVQICQVLLNLLNNARDAVEMLEQRWVQIDVREREGFVEFSVTDSGRGVPPELQTKIMQPFFSTKAPGKGTGLGLSISRSIVESHNGTLTLDPSSPNTRFVLRLPRIHVHQMQDQPGQKRAA